MDWRGWAEIVFTIGLTLALSVPLGVYLARVWTGERTWLDPVLKPVERVAYAAFGVDGSILVQVRQSLPFMDFSSAKWEMLVAVRNFFRETSIDQSIYDELLVVRPPKRIVGGLTLKF